MPAPGPNLLDYCNSFEDGAVELEAASRGKGKAKGTRLKSSSARLRRLVHQALFSSEFGYQVQISATKSVGVEFIPGQLWSEEKDRTKREIGPLRRADVMVIGKNPGLDEQSQKRVFIGPSGQLLREALFKFGLTRKQMDTFYVTNAVRFVDPLAHKSTSLKPAFIQECLLYLTQELWLVRPKLIYCLGSDALKVLLDRIQLTDRGLRERTATLTAVENRVLRVEYEGVDPLNQRFKHEAFVVATTHPAAVLHQPNFLDQFETGVSFFAQAYHQILNKQAPTGRVEKVRHEVVTTQAELAEALRRAEREIAPDKLVAVDAEWQGEHPQKSLLDGSQPWIRTIQLSVKEKTAIIVRLRDETGAKTFKPGEKAARNELRKFFKGKRVCAHNFNADLKWLTWWGLDLRPQFAVPNEDTEEELAWERTRHEGGFDTMLAMHAVFEAGRLGLEAAAAKFTSAPRYDQEFEDQLATFCKEEDERRRLAHREVVQEARAKHEANQKEAIAAAKKKGAEPKLTKFQAPKYKKFTKKQLIAEGYGFIPDAILLPYAGYDADVTYRIARKIDKLLDCDSYGLCSREPFWVAMRASAAILEINTTGIMVDRTRLDELVDRFMAAKRQLERKLRKWARWPDLVLTKVVHAREFLFGEKYNGTPIDPNTGTNRVRPIGARSLYLEPIMDTSKRPVLWEAIDPEDEDEHTAATGKMVLEQLSRLDDKKTATIVSWVRDWRYISQALKQFLRPPKYNDKGDPVRDANGNYVYTAGLGASLCDDGRTRTTILPTAETRRWKSRAMNLQNVSKTREKSYKTILGPHYLAPLRTMFVASPGHVLIEADFIGAELFVTAVLSGDPKMIQDCLRNQLPSDHPDHYDMHSALTVIAFRLDCSPSKKGLESVGKEALRNVTKTIFFGLLYGRSAKAISQALKSEGVSCSEQEAQQVIDTVFDTYPGLASFFAECRRRATADRYIVNAHGGIRRAPEVTDQTKPDIERQFMNLPIQGTVADQLNRVVDVLQLYREEVGIPDMFRIVLAIHDAVLLEVPIPYAGRVYNEVLEECMRYRVPLVPCRLDGSPRKGNVQYFGIDKEVYLRWGQKASDEDLQKLGLDPAEFKSH